MYSNADAWPAAGMSGIFGILGHGAPSLHSRVRAVGAADIAFRLLSLASKAGALPMTDDAQNSDSATAQRNALSPATIVVCSGRSSSGEIMSDAVEMGGLVTATDDDEDDDADGAGAGATVVIG